MYVTNGQLSVANPAGRLGDIARCVAAVRPHHGRAGARLVRQPHLAP